MALILGACWLEQVLAVVCGGVVGFLVWGFSAGCRAMGWGLVAGLMGEGDCRNGWSGANLERGANSVPLYLGWN